MLSDAIHLRDRARGSRRTGPWRRRACPTVGFFALRRSRPSSRFRPSSGGAIAPGGLSSSGGGGGGGGDGARGRRVQGWGRRFVLAAGDHAVGCVRRLRAGSPRSAGSSLASIAAAGGGRPASSATFRAPELGGGRWIRSSFSQLARAQGQQPDGPRSTLETISGRLFLRAPLASPNSASHAQESASRRCGVAANIQNKQPTTTITSTKTCLRSRSAPRSRCQHQKSASPTPSARAPVPRSCRARCARRTT